MMFGPPDDESPNSARSMAWKIKRFSNDDLRQRFIGMLVPQAEVLGLALPDPELRWDEDAQQWHTSPIDWDEFMEVLSGRGPMNAVRIQNRRTAHEDGAWVREAAAEYARKQQQKEAAA
jgi:ring-1,2-phenylacetyl-CoA epoxidase subunit PaaA